MSKRFTVSLWLMLSLSTGIAESVILPVELVCVDSEAHGYATFQSHNQKVISNSQGIFMTHLRTRGDGYNAQQWRLSWSKDRGRTFQTIYEAVDPTNPPVLETDATGNIYVIRPDFVDLNAYLYRFLSRSGYKSPMVSKIPRASAGKYAMAIDVTREQIYFLAHNGTFNVIGFDGAIRSGDKLLVQGPDAHLQYPHLNVDSQGDLHAAWTNTKRGGKLYWDIHHMYSTDGGSSWRTIPNERIDSPVVSDRHGPTLRVTLDDEFEVSTWLASFRASNDKLHFMYRAGTAQVRQHYVRFDRQSGKRDIDLFPSFGGEDLSHIGLDGFLVLGANGENVYAVGRDPKGHVICLISRDCGQNWNDYAKTAGRFNAYSIGGCREITKDGFIIGSFTDQKGSNAVNDRLSQVYFFRIKAE
jgi:hypothetical protein